MAEEKKSDILSKIVFTIFIIFLVIKVVKYVLPLLGPGPNSSDKTRSLIEQGAMTSQISVQLDDPKITITATTILGGSNMQSDLDFISNGLNEDQQDFVLQEVNILLEQCKDKVGNEKLDCVKAIDFTLPPYSVDHNRQSQSSE